MRPSGQRVLALPLTRRDGEVTLALLAQAGLDGCICVSLPMLSVQVTQGAGVIVLTEAALCDPAMEELLAVLDLQPAWSDLPVVLLARDRRPPPAVARMLGRLSNVTLLDRPASTRSMLSAVQSALRARARQYQIRDQLQAQEQAEAALRRSEENFRAIVDLVPDLLWSNVPDGHADWYNGRWSEYTGQCASTLLQQDWMGVVHPDDLPETTARWRHAIHAQQPFVREHRIRRHDGIYRWHLVRAEPLRDAQGRVGRWFGSATDIHEQHSARELLERRVRQRTQEMHTILHSAASAIIASDLGGRVTLFNPAAEAMLRIPARDATGRLELDFRDHEEMRQRLHLYPQEVLENASQLPGWLAQAARNALATPRVHVGSQRSEWTYVRADGSRVPALMNISLLRDEHGKPTGFLTVGTDLSERKTLEDELRERTRQAEAASRAKSAFLAHMSHEFRTPLNAVIGLSQLLGQMPLPDRAQGFIKHIAQAGEQLLGLTNDVLDLSRIEAGELVLESVAFEPLPLLGTVLALVKPQADGKGLALVADIDARMPRRLVGDPLRWRQILLNLLSNAVKFTPAGSVTLRARVMAQAVQQVRLRLEVADTGIGIAADAHERIFERFTQADDSTTRRFGGSGLGLSIVRRLVHMMDGSLSVRSQPDQGSTFTVELPCRCA